MPFKSRAQQEWMYANTVGRSCKYAPAMAKERQKDTPKGKKLPKRVSKKPAKKK